MTFELTRKVDTKFFNVEFNHKTEKKRSEIYK